MANKPQLIPYAHKGRHGKKNPLKNQPAAYVIIHPTTEKMYIGSTGDLSGRCSENLKNLRNNEHKNKPLQENYNKEPLIGIAYVPCKDVEEAQNIEQHLVKEIYKDNKVFNVAIENTKLTGVGRKLSKEHVDILKQSNINRDVSLDTKEKMRQSKLRYDATEEGKKRIAELAARSSKPITIDNIKYDSISEASRQLNITWKKAKRISK